MLKNYVTIALRTLRKHTGYAFINVTGLAVGMAVCLLIVLFVRDEWSYDRFHENANQIYRVTWDVGSFGKTASVPASMLPRFKEDFPEVQVATHLVRHRTVVVHEGKLVQEDNFFYADSTVFDVFSFPLVAGDASTALQAPNTVVLTQSTAQRYFGARDPLGETLVLKGNEVLRVTGVMEDVPATSHLQFDALASLITLTGQEMSAHRRALAFQGWLYLLLDGRDAAASVDARLDGITDAGMESMRAFLGWAFDGSSFDLQPLTRIHLYSNLSREAGPNSDVRYLYIFSLVAAFILLLACINYMNLATARSMQRAKEVGVRKVVGAGRCMLAGQFLMEALVLSGLAMVGAILLVELLLPLFNQLTGKALVLSYDAFMISLVLGAALITGLAAGSYPALFLTRLDPIRILRGSLRSQTKGRGLRKGLVVFQFTVSIALIAGTLVVQQQLDYLRNKRLGYDTEQIIQVPLRGGLQTRAAAFKTELERQSGVVHVALASGVPGRGSYTTPYEYEGKEQQVRVLAGDPDYLETMGMNLVQGRSFNHADTTAFLVNALGAQRFSLAGKLGQPDVLDVWEGVSTPIGVVSDFHTASLHEPILPTIIVMDDSHFETVVLRLQQGHTVNALGAIEAIWRRFVPEEPFTYLFLDDMLATQYQAEQRLGNIFATFSLLAVFIACLGLFGLAAFTAEQRTKEIGIRKVLGASVSNLVALLSRDFLKLVVLAFVMAVPIVYFAVARWLEGFAYRIDLSWPIFLIAGSLALAIAVLTVSYQAIRTARANPVDSLRYE